MLGHRRWGLLHRREMSIDAVALLKRSSLRDTRVGSQPGFLEHALEDAVLFHTHARFGHEPDELAFALRAQLGELLDAHHDERGVFLLPDVALEHAMQAQRYDAVIEAIGEAGMWCPLVSADFIPQRMQDDAVMALLARAQSGEEISPESLQAGLQSMMESMRQSGLSEAESGESLDEERTNPGLAQANLLNGPGLLEMLKDPALMALAEQMKSSMMGDESSDENLLGEDDSDFGEDGTDPEFAPTDTSVESAMPMDLGALMSSPAFAQLLAQAQEAIAKNPEHARALAARFGVAVPASDDDKDD